MYVLTLCDYVKDHSNNLIKIGEFLPLYYHSFKKAKKAGIEHIQFFLDTYNLDYEYDIKRLSDDFYYGGIKDNMLFSIGLVRTED